MATFGRQYLSRMDRCQHGRSVANFRTMRDADQSIITRNSSPPVATCAACFAFQTNRYGMLHKPRRARLAAQPRAGRFYRYNRHLFAIPTTVSTGSDL
jgi:hypothetical protein